MFDVWLDDSDVRILVERNREVPDAAFLHLDIKGKWNTRLAYRLYTLIDPFMQSMKRQGTTHVYAFNKNQDDKWRKFMRMYGWTLAFTTSFGRDVYVRKVSSGS